MPTVISYTPCIVDIIEENTLELIIVALHEAVDPMVPDGSFYQLHNQILYKLGGWGHATVREVVNAIHKHALLSRIKQSLGIKVGLHFRGAYACEAPLKGLSIDSMFTSYSSKILN